MEHHELTKRRQSSVADILKRSLMQYCPSPCLAKPCRRVLGVDMPNRCNAVGPFEVSSSLLYAFSEIATHFFTLQLLLCVSIGVNASSLYNRIFR